jgi:hypothetical protein
LKTVYAFCEKCGAFNNLSCECEECYTRGYICKNCGHFNAYNVNLVVEVTN